MKWKRWRNLVRLFPGIDLRGVQFVSIRKHVPIPGGGRSIADKNGAKAVVHPMFDSGRRGLVIRYLPEPESDAADRPQDTGTPGE